MQDLVVWVGTVAWLERSSHPPAGSGLALSTRVPGSNNFKKVFSVCLEAKQYMVKY
jgi:hypothetical protein